LTGKGEQPPEMEEAHRIRSIALAPERSVRPRLDLQMGVVIDAIQEIGVADDGSRVGLGRPLLGLLAQAVETERLFRPPLQFCGQVHLGLSTLPEAG
jgi:hypothetical protein